MAQKNTRQALEVSSECRMKSAKTSKVRSARESAAVNSRRNSSAASRESAFGTTVRSRGPSVAALAALATLAACLWFDVELSVALFRSVLVYLGVSLMALLYRVILSHYLSISQERAQQEFLERVQREAESAAADHKSQREAESPTEAVRGKTSPAAGSPTSAGGKKNQSQREPLVRELPPTPGGRTTAEPKSNAITSPSETEKRTSPKAVETA